MKEIPQLPVTQNEAPKYQNLIGQLPPTEAQYWGRVGRPDYSADVYKLDDLILFVNRRTKKVYKVSKNDGSMTLR